VLAELGRIESKVVKEANPNSTLDEIAKQVHKTWVEAAESKINDSWRIFADAQISAQEGRQAVLENLRGFSHHLAEEIQEGYQQPDEVITGHHIINLDLPLEGVPDEYRIYHNPLRIEIREFKSYGGAKVNETSKLQACGYQLLLETLYPNADFKLKVYARDDVVKVRMTDIRRQHLLEGIQTITEVYEHARGRAKPIPQLCAVCGVNQACQYYFNDSQPPNVRKYLWRLRMQTLEEKGQNQGWKWKSKLLSTETRAELGITDSGYKISELTSQRVRLVKDGRPNVLPGDTVIVSAGNPLTTPSFTGEVSELGEDSVTIVPYGDLPMGLPDHDLTIDQYDVDLTRRQLGGCGASSAGEICGTCPSPSGNRASKNRKRIGTGSIRGKSKRYSTGRSKSCVKRTGLRGHTWAARYRQNGCHRRPPSPVGTCRETSARSLYHEHCR